MSKEFPSRTSTCSKQTNFVLNDDHTIASIEVVGGCNGNLKGICQLLTGMKQRTPLPVWTARCAASAAPAARTRSPKNLKRLWKQMN